MHRDAERLQRVMVSRAKVAVALLTTACYSYVPLAEPLPRESDDVRVHLTPSGAVDLAREIGPRIAVVDGRVLALRRDSSLMLAVSQLKSMSGEQMAWQGDAPLVIPRSAIASVDRRQLARGRTVAASTGATAALAAIGVLAVRSAGKGSGTGGQPPPPPP